MWLTVTHFVLKLAVPVAMLLVATPARAHGRNTYGASHAVVD